jgi:hypothetical protein
MPPIEDPRRDGSKRDGLRIGGWLETFPGRRALPGRPPLVTPPPPRVPVFHPVQPRETRRPPVPVFAQVDSPRQVRLRVAVTCLVALAVGGTTFAVLADRAGTAPGSAQVTVADPVTLEPMPASLPSSPSPASPSASPAPSRSPSASPLPARRKAPAAIHHKSPKPTRPPLLGGLRAGGTLSLAMWGRSRVNFVVHAASGGCVTLESARFRGFYLRSRGQWLQFVRSGGSAFCPVPAGDGMVRLRSGGRYVVAFRGGLFLASVPASRAAEFAPD